MAAKLLIVALIAPSALAFAPAHVAARALRAPASSPSFRKAGSALVQMQSTPAQEVKDVPFEVRGFSYSTVVLGAATAITFYSFFQFFLNDGEASSSLGFVYGFPGLLLGAALKYAEVPPVPVEGTAATEAARQALANANLKKIHSDVTRFRYADAHLEDALTALGLRPRGEGPPELLKVVESVMPDGAYSMELVFGSNATPYNAWTRNAHRYANFFGPNVRAVVTKLSAERREVSLALVTTKPGESTLPVEKQPDGTTLPIELDGTVANRAD
ncbi:hypothetical protein KFE25_001227 [Diacronema lutheri]|uniref:Thylakoid membrane protein n=2 Tax=Diacronema lutheri TaxID=2081491 RepID=A0A8J5XD94_DIALT|nr:hypothetical protein KFE25_001227 [Diacronema lutheri]